MVIQKIHTHVILWRLIRLIYVFMYLYTYVSQELMKNTMNLRVRRNIWESLEEGKKEINDINIFKTQKHKKYFFQKLLSQWGWRDNSELKRWCTWWLPTIYSFNSHQFFILFSVVIRHTCGSFIYTLKSNHTHKINALKRMLKQVIKLEIIIPDQ